MKQIYNFSIVFICKCLRKKLIFKDDIHIIIIYKKISTEYIKWKNARVFFLMAFDLVKLHISQRIRMLKIKSDWKHKMQRFVQISNAQAEPGPTEFCAMVPEGRNIFSKKTCNLYGQLLHRSFIFHTRYERCISTTHGMI